MSNKPQGADGAGTMTVVGISLAESVEMGGHLVHWRAILAQLRATPAPATPPGVPDSLRALLEDAFNRGFDLAEGNWHEGTEWFQWAKEKRAKEIEDILAAQPAGQSEPPILRVTVDVFADRTDTRLAFGDRIRPEPGIKAVEQAIAALTAEYEARGGCPVVGRHPAGQAGDAGAFGAALERFDAHRLAISQRGPSAIRAKLLSELDTIRNSMCRVAKPAPNSTRPEAPSDVPWRPMSEAPTDGRDFIAGLWVYNTNRVRIGWQQHFIRADDEADRTVSPYTYQGWDWDDYTHCLYVEVPPPPSDPAPSGQEG